MKRLPSPPPAFIHFQWKSKPYSNDNNVPHEVCPVCDSFGSFWKGGGFTDPKAQAFYDKILAENDGYLRYDQFSRKFEGVPLKMHWSRYGIGECCKCKVEYWHDFVDYPWRYYYNPASSKISHTYTPSLF